MQHQAYTHLSPFKGGNYCQCGHHDFECLTCHRLQAVAGGCSLRRHGSFACGPLDRGPSRADGRASPRIPTTPTHRRLFSMLTFSSPLAHWNLVRLSLSLSLSTTSTIQRDTSKIYLQNISPASHSPYQSHRSCAGLGWSVEVRQSQHCHLVEALSC